MIKLIKSKLKSRAGETLAETLIAVLISALALVLLLSMITGSSRLVAKGEEKMQEMYDGSAAIERKSEGVIKENIEVIVTDNSLSDKISDIRISAAKYSDSKSSLSNYEYNSVE